MFLACAVSAVPTTWLPAVTVHTDAAAWEERARSLNASSKTLFVDFMARMARRIGRVQSDGKSVTVVLPVSDRAATDDDHIRGNRRSEQGFVWHSLRVHTGVPPTGVVTFLFIDVEGSTRRWEADTEKMRAALAAHDQVLRRGDRGAWGLVVQAHGVCAAFASPRSAVDAAVAAQLELEAVSY